MVAAFQRLGREGVRRLQPVGRRHPPGPAPTPRSSPRWSPGSASTASSWTRSRRAPATCAPRWTPCGPAMRPRGRVRVPLARIADHAMSWAQWFADSEVPGVLRANWFERRHMLHHTRRWHRDHLDELHSAWLNGCRHAGLGERVRRLGRLERAGPGGAARRCAASGRPRRVADRRGLDPARRSRPARARCTRPAGSTTAQPLWTVVNRGDGLTTGRGWSPRTGRATLRTTWSPAPS